MNAHRNKKYKAWSVIYICKNYSESRVMKQAVLSACIAEHIFNLGVGTSNKIRGISIRRLKNFWSDFEVIGQLLKCPAENLYYLALGY